MNPSADLDISNYNKRDLFDLFELRMGENYDDAMINSKFDRLSSKILNAKNIDYAHKMQLVDFLKKGLNKLIYDNVNNNDYNYKLTTGSFMPNLEKNTVYPNKHFVIKRNERKDLTSLINPLNKAKMIKLLNINTLFRKNYYGEPSTDFTFELPTEIKNVISIGLETTEIPNKQNLYSDTVQTNEFTIETFDKRLTGDAPTGDPMQTGYVGEIINKQRKRILIQNGTYTGREIVEYLNTKIFDKDPHLKRVGVMYHEPTGKIIFFRDTRTLKGEPLDGNFEFGYNLDFNLNNQSRAIQYNMGWLLGFRKQYYEFYRDYVTENELNPENFEGFNPEAANNDEGNSYIYLSVDTFNNNHAQVILSPFDSSTFNDTSILAKLPMNSFAGESDFNYQSGSVQIGFVRNYFGPVNVRRIKIRLLDQMGRVIDLNNIDYSFTLKLEQVYDLNTNGN